ncbi:MAG: hypothetical protein QM820_39585 [Minicystis sp.]
MGERRESTVATAEQLAASLQELVGKRCWGVVAGEGTGSVVSLKFGGQTRRKKPLPNPSLSPAVREYEAEYSMLVQCVWRLDAPDRIVCGAWDSNEAGGAMLTGLGEIVNHDVRLVTIAAPSADLEMVFDNGLKLKVFCDRINVDEAEDNYCFYTPAAVFTVGTRSALSVRYDEPRTLGGAEE